MFDVRKIDVQRLGLEAACQMAYEKGLAEGREDTSQGAFLQGMCAGSEAFADHMQLRGTVTAVYRDKGNTVLAFADGGRSKVHYDTSYGYAYDDEKAIMAAMLKKLVGNYYIKVLRQFGDGDVPAAGHVNAGPSMLRKAAPAEQEAVHQYDAIAMPEGDMLYVAPEPPEGPVAGTYPENPDDSMFLHDLADEPDLYDAMLFQD